MAGSHIFSLIESLTTQALPEDIAPARIVSAHNVPHLLDNCFPLIVPWGTLSKVPPRGKIYAKLKMGITLQPFVWFTCFNFWLVVLGAFYHVGHLSNIRGAHAPSAPDKLTYGPLPKGVWAQGGIPHNQCLLHEWFASYFVNMRSEVNSSSLYISGSEELCYILNYFKIWLVIEGLGLKSCPQHLIRSEPKGPKISNNMQHFW